MLDNGLAGHMSGSAALSVLRGRLLLAARSWDDAVNHCTLIGCLEMLIGCLATRRAVLGRRR